MKLNHATNKQLVSIWSRLKRNALDEKLNSQRKFRNAGAA